jgi:hypothetical protein
MKRKRNYRLVVYLVLLFTLLVLAWLRSRKQREEEPLKVNNETRFSANRNREFDRRTSIIEYTKHAKCRMQCRQITAAEVKDIMQNGSVNYRKSNVNAKPCPEYAVEGYTKQDDQHVRIVFAQCDYKTKVVTCIDLDKDFDCTCN